MATSQFITHRPTHTHFLANIQLNSRTHVLTCSLTALHCSPVNKQRTLRGNRNVKTNV